MIDRSSVSIGERPTAPPVHRRRPLRAAGIDRSAGRAVGRGGSLGVGGAESVDGRGASGPDEREWAPAGREGAAPTDPETAVRAGRTEPNELRTRFPEAALGAGLASDRTATGVKRC